MEISLVWSLIIIQFNLSIRVHFIIADSLTSWIANESEYDVYDATVSS